MQLKVTLRPGDLTPIDRAILSIAWRYAATGYVPWKSMTMLSIGHILSNGPLRGAYMQHANTGAIITITNEDNAKETTEPV